MRIVVLIVALLMGCDAMADEWRRLAALPDPEGFAGPYAGISHGALLVAGGGNFPGKKPWEGGQKVWYDSVFVLEHPGGEWKQAGKLPRPLGYGVCVTFGESVVCVGGSDAERHYADAFRLEWKQGELLTTKLPSLPTPLANASGALVGETLYVAGGLLKPDAASALKTGWKIDLSAAEPKWERIDDCPGSGRMLAVAASCDGAFWLLGGVELVVGTERAKAGQVERRYLNDAYRYDPSQGWQQIADLPHASVAAPSPAPV